MAIGRAAERRHLHAEPSDEMSPLRGSSSSARFPTLTHWATQLAPLHGGTAHAYATTFQSAFLRMVRRVRRSRALVTSCPMRRSNARHKSKRFVSIGMTPACQGYPRVRKGASKMAENLRVTCINKSDRYNPHERIINVGGVDGGQRWKMSKLPPLPGSKAAGCRCTSRKAGGRPESSWQRAPLDTSTSRQRTTGSNPTTCSVFPSARRSPGRNSHGRNASDHHVPALHLLGL